jgi:uncharacterized protein YndB with AHSA1/START domain
MKVEKGEITIDGGRATIVFRRLLHHSIDRVWRAITDPDELAAWMLESAKIEPRQGGRIEYVSAPEPIVWYGRILVWDPPHLYEHEFDTDPDPRWSEHLGAERTIARWELERRGGSTVLTLIFRGFTERTTKGFAPGTHAFLDRLDAWLASGPLPDWRARFEELQSLYGWTEG